VDFLFPSEPRSAPCHYIHHVPFPALFHVNRAAASATLTVCAFKGAAGLAHQWAARSAQPPAPGRNWKLPSSAEVAEHSRGTNVITAWVTNEPPPPGPLAGACGAPAFSRHR